MFGGVVFLWKFSIRDLTHNSLWFGGCWKKLPGRMWNACDSDDLKNFHSLFCLCAYVITKTANYGNLSVCSCDGDSWKEGAGSGVTIAATTEKQGPCFGNSIGSVWLLGQFAVKCRRHLLEAKHPTPIGFEDVLNIQFGGRGQNGLCMQMWLVTSLNPAASSKYWSVFKDLFGETTGESVANIFHSLGTVLASCVR